MSGAGNIKVVVRCRPLNARELARGATCLVRMEGQQTIIRRPDQKDNDVKAFTFDRSFWSANKDDPEYADQETVYQDLGRELLDHAFDGYNCCIFAYGQTGSGKSYSMMGYGKDKGIIPRTCSELFERIQQTTRDGLTFEVEVSYIEIYNEKVRDLLNPRNKGNLKVREHPSLGPYVEDLSRLAVKSFEDINYLMDEGNKARTVAATNMNGTSSRSHAVFTILLTQKRYNPATKQTNDKIARISLVDLAGSERANSTGASGLRLKEGANINKSLTTLGKVIAGLAEQATMQDNKKGTRKSKEAFIPFRDSILTWLLKDSLGGNSKTAMIAAISPADYDETLSTLRYADQAKKIRTKAVVNEDPHMKMVRELEDELKQLRQALMVYAPDELEKITSHKTKSSSKLATNGTNAANGTNATNTSAPPKSIVFTDAANHATELTKTEMLDQIQTSEKLLNELNQTWEEKLQNSEKIHMEREQALEELGITIEKNHLGIHTPKKMPHLVNLSEDPLMSECLMYQIKPGITRVGHLESQAHIRLSGSSIMEEHCIFENVDNVVTLNPKKDSVTMVNGLRISEPKRLKSGYRVILGDYHIFRFNHPEEARKERDLLQRMSSPTGMERSASQRPDSPSQSSGSDAECYPHADWTFALREALLNSANGDVNFGNLADEDLEKILDDVTKLRRIRQRQSTSSSSSEGQLFSDNFSQRTSLSSQTGLFSTHSTLLDDMDSASREGSVKSFHEEMQQRLAQQKKKYESKLQRLSMYLPASTCSLYSPLVDAAEIALARKYVQRWKRKRWMALSETVSVNRHYIVEANAYSRQHHQSTVYQLVIVHDNASLDARSALEPCMTSDVDPVLSGQLKPCIAVRVIDCQQQTTGLWSLSKLKTRVRHMQGIHCITPRLPHFESQDLFRDLPQLHYALTGTTQVPLRHLDFHIPMERQLDIFCRDTGAWLGHLTVLVAPIARSIARTPKETYSAAEPPSQHGLLHVGQQLLFDIRILELSGPMTAECTDIHCQFSLSDFGVTVHNVFTTDPVSPVDGSSVRFDYSQTISMVITPEILDTIRHQSLRFDVFAKPRPGYFEQCMINATEATIAALDIRSPTTPTLTLPMSDIPAKDHRPRVHRESYPIFVSIQIRELGSRGDYQPVPVKKLPWDSTNIGLFCLRQGQQRRIHLTMKCDASWHVNKISSLCIGHVRLVDAQYRVINDLDTTSVPLKVVQQQQENELDEGPGFVIESAWDSSLHDSLLLNQATAPDQRVVFTLSWSAHTDKYPVSQQYTIDVCVRISGHERETPLNKRSSMFRFFSSDDVASLATDRACAVFELQMIKLMKEANETDPMIAKYRDGWQAMSRKESIASTDYTVTLMTQLQKRRNKIQQGITKIGCDDGGDTKQCIDNVIHLWRSAVPPKDMSACSRPSPDIPCYKCEVYQILPLGSVTKRGLLTWRIEPSQGTSSNDRWVVLRRPYLLVYEDQSESNVLNVFKVTRASVPTNDLTIPNTFEMYTSNSTYYLQANDQETVDSWVSALNNDTT
ncbi:uncharacterized protein BYT42DRAFT_616646 [Radiomyces spectabilis]|uniref:uncharacterized protein n=1 Tax=Radiomyces spectabilis TaxID=64574 RepID=UPI00221E5F8F|nr:uncharacterized protein BYT42DRAFT_616646 [Radiomyces spectabilis]KAI8371561.1 hypothetical protein BYT42DRAFT_616646 [Radiomyces spectabilis]